MGEIWFHYLTYIYLLLIRNRIVPVRSISLPFPCHCKKGQSVTCDRLVVFSRSSGFLHQLNWPPRYNWNIVESGVNTIKQTNIIVKIQNEMCIFIELLKCHIYCLIKQKGGPVWRLNIKHQCCIFGFFSIHSSIHFLCCIIWTPLCDGW